MVQVGFPLGEDIIDDRDVGRPDRDPLLVTTMVKIGHARRR